MCRRPREHQGAERPSSGRRLVRALFVVLSLSLTLSAVGCHQLDHRDAAVPNAASRESVSLLPHAKRQHARGQRLELHGSDESVDRFYEAAVYAYAGILATTAAVGRDHPDAVDARELYNECLRDCLRTAQEFGRIDARSHLQINSPAGSLTVPIEHRGFVWQPWEFNRVVDPTRLKPNPHQHGIENLRAGVGADLAVGRTNPKVSSSDQLLPRETAFNATAILRPDLEAWLGGQRGSTPADRLELIDPMRIRSVTIERQEFSLTGNYDASNAMAKANQDLRGDYATLGFLRPADVIERADIRILEPYRPGKIPVLLVHGLRDDPFMFSVIISALNSTPGFLDRYQVWVYRYPTGVTFLRSAALLREDLSEALTTLDPESRDPALRQTILVAFSMGGLISRLQIVSSGDVIWNGASNRPLDSLVTSEETRSMLRKLFYFEPSPSVGRVIFIATPQKGSPLASSIVGRIATRMVTRPSSTSDAFAQVARDNPGALKPMLTGRPPSSIDMMREDNPLAPLLPQLQVNPSVKIHTIAGYAQHSSEHARGDLVVPMENAHIDGAESELFVPAMHTNIYYQPETIAEIQRILGLESGMRDPG